MRPVDTKFPVSQEFGSCATAGVNPNQNGTEVEQLVYMYGNYQPYGHAGQDIACPIGTPVHAIADGTVLWADWGTNLPGDESDAGYRQRWYLYKTFPGIVTLIQHDGWISIYAHMSEAPLNLGDVVTEGQQIGLSGNTRSPGVSLGAHLHVGALVDLNYPSGNGLIYGCTDPEPYFGGFAAQASTITPVQEDTLSQAEVDQLYSAMMTRIAQLEESLTKTIKDQVAALPVQVWSYTNPNIAGGDAFQHLRDIPANVWNKEIPLPDGTKPNASGILVGVNARQAAAAAGPGAAADPTAVVRALRDQLNK